MKKQTAGRDALGVFAPKFAELNDDVLFGEVWSREDKLSLRDRCIVTVTVLMTKGIFDNSLKYHLKTQKTTALRQKKWLRSLLIPPSTPAGRTPGRLLPWRRKFIAKPAPPDKDNDDND